jgi:type I restriction enzyme S subunit
VSNLPASWDTANVLELSKFVRGVTYSKKDVQDNPQDGFTAILRATNITEKGFDFSDLVFVPKNFIKDEQFIRAGDVVIATSSGSIKVVGKANQARENLDAAFGAFCGVLRLTSEVDTCYFGHFFSTEYYRSTVSSLARGVNINNLRRDHFEKNYYSPCPTPRTKTHRRQTRYPAGASRLVPIPPGASSGDTQTLSAVRVSCSFSW